MRVRWDIGAMPRAVDRMVRILIGTICGFWAAKSFVAVGSLLLSSLGVPPGDATGMTFIAGVLLFVGLVVWTAASCRLVLLSLGMVGFTIASTFFTSQLAPG